ncbi:cytochrome bc complex cytochrome b subunit [Haloarcula sp. S1CR25-12]|uniref:Cytochrome bc complex cytochrome b subunit n=1 Tax=Haloarcula saliterrae TaxID=2950534 RepID=A0ABU2FG71_9EURY|nr:cytochrome bc complex cytochrome b subunit [Haloarcula sp. S1CR25-12]MDS0261232.1 cytochrome bc complex cytochrome b subunit [Haloarcula sp. S1CR25-12]
MSRAEWLYDWFDTRLDVEGAQSFLGKAFPAEDSFLLGEVAVFCFILLVLSGVFLGLFFEPSTSDVEYDGSVQEYQGEEMPEAFVSVLHITYDVPFGMFIRRLHHWAAHLFVASIGLHMLRVFFTGSYRNPREPNWLVGTGLAALSMGAAYTGYALPFDEFAATATGIGYNLTVSVPLVGDFFGQVIFGGEFPSSATIPRLYFLHVLVLPVAISAGIAVHMAILVRQKHTEAPRDEAVETGERTVDAADDSVIVGLPAVPNQAAVSAVVFFLTAATLSALAGLLPVHNIAEYGPNDPASTPALIMPDWFLMWVYGFLKLLPQWASFTVGPVHVSGEFIGGVVLPGLVFLAVGIWPFVDREPEPTHFTANPLERPWQTAVGVAAVAFIMIASIAGMNNILAAQVLGTTTSAVNPILTAALLGVPPLFGAVTYLLLRDGDSATPPDSEATATPDGGDPPDELRGRRSDGGGADE